MLIVAVYSHHLYLDFVQPRWAQIVSSIASFASLLPVAVITIYSMTMLVWGSRYRWTLGSTLLYIGLAGWAIGGTGAVIDSVIPINFRFHNTVWVVAHFHTYLMMTVVVWALAFLAHLLERDAGRTSGPAYARERWRCCSSAASGWLGHGSSPACSASRAATRSSRPGRATTASSAASSRILFALGFVAVLVQLVPLARTA